MNISSFFIERPIFATVLAIIITVAGLLAMPVLPISEYPEIVPVTEGVLGVIAMPKRYTAGFDEYESPVGAVSTVMFTIAIVEPREFDAVTV